jgi:tRNA/tmRNA/rRNA uracil-C5-methylase (TrmA/RlmC/RlmD family)
MNKKIFFDKLFPWKQGVNRNNLHIDYECVSYITLPRDSEKIVKLISEKMEKYKKKEDITIVDSTACVGGDTISFCHNFGIVIPIEIDSNRYKDLLHNINLYNIQNAFPINGNCLEKIPEIEINIDVIFIDPPWGGSDYKLQDKLDIKMDDKDLDQIITSLFIKNVKLVVLKLPKNYNYENLIPKLKSYRVTLNKEIKKIDVLLVEKIC